MTFWTIGHSTLPLERFLAALTAHRIAMVADVRRYPGSRRHPHFGAESLAGALRGAGIEYLHLPELGGRRRPRADSRNTAIRHESFRGYADYMETPEFEAGIARLAEAAARAHLAVLCAERTWRECHRGMIADFLKVRGHTVLHILAADHVEEHPYTGFARIVDGGLTYRGLPL